jgi:hypothetical protein
MRVGVEVVLYSAVFVLAINQSHYPIFISCAIFPQDMQAACPSSWPRGRYPAGFSVSQESKARPVSLKYFKNNPLLCSGI